jgi:hypothetical protein
MTVVKSPLFLPATSSPGRQIYAPVDSQMLHIGIKELQDSHVILTLISFIWQ